MRVRDLKFEQLYRGMIVRSCNDGSVIGTITIISNDGRTIGIQWNTKKAKAAYYMGHADSTTCKYDRCDCEIVSHNDFFFISNGKAK